MEALNTSTPQARESKEITRERWKLLRKLDTAMKTPLLVLSLVWLVLILMEFIGHLPPFLERTWMVIWGLFVADYFMKLVLAPDKGKYVKSNLLTAGALLFPALRLVQVLPLATMLSTAPVLVDFRLVHVLASANWGISVLGKMLACRKVGYFLAVTVVVIFSGAAGVYIFEGRNEMIPDYGTALWWTLMILAMGTNYFPKTVEGRIVFLLLALYGFAILAYVVSSLASHFLGKKSEKEELKNLKEEILSLKQELSSAKSKRHSA